MTLVLCLIGHQLQMERLQIIALKLVRSTLPRTVTALKKLA